MPPSDTPLGSTPVTVHVPHSVNVDPSVIAQGFQLVMPIITDVVAKNYGGAVKDAFALVVWGINTFGPKPAPVPTPAPPAPSPAP
jgi:hypothetical protein